MGIDWPKKYITWIEKRTLFVSVPFTWNLPEVRAKLEQICWDWDNAIVGGPAVYLMPEFFEGLDNVEIGYEMPGVLQRVKSSATRTTAGCIRKCRFCAVPGNEGKLIELEDWPDLPNICDNNILAASEKHLEKVFDRLEKHNEVDFEQGVDARLIDEYRAERIGRLNVMCRLALDGMKYAESWERAFLLLRKNKIPLSRIRSYCIIGFDTDPAEAWERCKWIEGFKIKPLPMWFHSLDCLRKNEVSEHQKSIGWNDYERRKIMQWFYQHKKATK
jgi:hypothetical protein